MPALIKSKETLVNEWIENMVTGTITQLKNANEIEHVKFNQGRLNALEKLQDFISNGYKEFDY
jgi:hypothetical protein